MKRISMLLALSVSALSGTLMAQMQREVTVHLQNPIQVNTTTLPAGDYTIHVQNVGGTDTQVLLIQSSKASVMSLASRRPAEPANAGRTHLVLEVKDGVYHLDKLVIGDNSYELQ